MSRWTLQPKHRPVKYNTGQGKWHALLIATVNVHFDKKRITRPKWFTYPTIVIITLRLCEILDSTFFLFLDSTFWSDSTLKINHADDRRSHRQSTATYTLKPNSPKSLSVSQVLLLLLLLLLCYGSSLQRSDRQRQYIHAVTQSQPRTRSGALCVRTGLSESDPNKPVHELTHIRERLKTRRGNGRVLKRDPSERTTRFARSALRAFCFRWFGKPRHVTFYVAMWQTATPTNCGTNDMTIFNSP